MSSYKDLTPNSKQKRTVDHLMSIIRTLSSNATTEQREKEKARLEKAYRESDEKLVGLITENQGDLTSIMQAFSNISKRVSSSQQKVQSVKDNLQSCKNLLQCKRDELKKLWLEGLEHKIAVQMLDQINSMRDVSDRLQSHIESKHYLHATDLLVSSVKLLHTDLANVEALKDIRVELDAKKEELYMLLIDELHKQIYVRSTVPVMSSFQREGSQRHSNRLYYKSKHSLGMTGANAGESKAAQLMKAIDNINLEDASKPQTITEDLSGDAEENLIHFIAVLIESLARLGLLPEAIEALRSRIKPGLLAVVQRSSQQVSDNAYFDDEELSTTNNPQYLLELLDLVIKRFRVVAKVHNIILANLKRIKSSNTSEYQFILYNSSEVWMKIQNVLQLFASDYLDLCNTSGGDVHTLYSYDADAPIDINAYFAKKRNPKARKFALFRFDHSSHAISMNSYFREQRAEFYGPGDATSSAADSAAVASSVVTESTKQTLVCKPSVTNITVIYKPLQKFIAEIEQHAQLAPRTCMLYGIVSEFISNNYLAQVKYNIQKSIDSATKVNNEQGFDARRHVADHRKQKELNAPKPLLFSTATVASNVNDLQVLMYDLPDYGEQFIEMICKILTDYRETCHASYRDIVGNDSEEKQVVSATWAKDEDICRLLRGLPNWQALKDISHPKGSALTDIDDLRALNSKESQTLTSNLSSLDIIPQNEIVSDMADIKTLANMCESLEWLCEMIRDLCTALSIGAPPTAASSTVGSTTNSTVAIKVSYNHSQSAPAVSEATLDILSKLARDFEDISELCLLVLHLEVRVHCFYHLLPLAKQSNYSGAIDDMDPDKHVLKMIKDLNYLEENISQNVQPKKFRYIFEGLAHLASTILINSTQYLKRINENGIKKMCRNIFSLQQSLNSISTSHEREADLDHARQYYELLYRSPEDILNTIMERGPQFTEHEYTQLLSLNNRSVPGRTEAQLHAQLDRLKNILTDFETAA